MNVPSQLNSVPFYVVLQYWTYSTQGKIWEKKYRPVPTWELHGTVPSDLSHQTSSSRIASKAGVRTSGAVLVSQIQKQYRSRGNNIERKVLPKKKIQQPICCSGPLALQGPIAPPLYSFGQKQRIGSMENVAAMLATDWYEMIWTYIYMNYTISLLSSTLQTTQQIKWCWGIDQNTTPKRSASRRQVLRHCQIPWWRIDRLNDQGQFSSATSCWKIEKLTKFKHHGFLPQYSTFFTQLYRTLVAKLHIQKSTKK